MKIWIYTTKEPLEYLKLDEEDEIKRSSINKAKKGDLILIYRGSPHSSIAHIFIAKTDPYEDKGYRDDWDTFIDLTNKIQLNTPLKLQEMKKDSILGNWGIVRKNFMGSFFEVPNKEAQEIKRQIVDKNPELAQEINDSFSNIQTVNKPKEIKKWTFAINKDFYFELKESDEILWNSAKDVKKDDIIFVYTGSPYSNIGFVLKALTDPFEDKNIRATWNRPAITVKKEFEISEPVSFQELKINPILSNWGAVKMGFRGSHFKMSDEEYNELKRLVLEKNPELSVKFDFPEIISEESEEIGPDNDLNYYDINAGRAHIVRDICYLVYKENFPNPEALFNSLREKVGENESYWKAYYQRSNKQNSPGYNLNSARNLGLVEKNQLELTNLGQKLVNSIEKSELFNYNYSVNVKKFFFQLALKNHSIKTAMRISREKGKLRFYSPSCDRTNKTFWRKSIKRNYYQCDHDEHPECKNCDRDFSAHIKESSLPFETLEETRGKGYGFVFWMCSRVTPMYLTGTEPGYSGNYIYWDKTAAEELGNLVTMLDGDIKENTPRIWKITPGEPEKSEIYWPIYTEKGFIGIGWTEFKKDFRDFDSQEKLKTELDKVYGESKSQSAKMIWDFTNEIKVGDYVIANRGKKGVIGIGIIQSNYIGPNDPENLNLTEYPHLRKVDWKIIYNIEISGTFDRKTVTELDGKRWNEIIGSYARMNPEFKKELLETIYNEFKNGYLDTEVGQDHLKAYQEESEKIKNIYLAIQDDKENGIDATDKILYGLVPHRHKSIVGFVVDIKAFLEKKLEIKPQKFPEIADNLFITIQSLVENDEDPQLQSNIIDKFVNSEFSKGFGAGTLTPPLFFIDHKYPFINNKTVDTVAFMSKIIGEPVNIDRELKHYIENKSKLEKFISELSTYIPGISDFYIFDIFCHWMCDKNLGYYAKEKPLPIIGEVERPPKPKIKPVFLNPSLIKTDLLLKPKILEQICGTINSGKHIMLTGAPGTGKTNLALDVCKVAVDYEFTNGYVLTTATSDWTTFDTIGGYMPNEKGQLIFKEGKFLQAIRENKWLIIDEINRSDIDKAFGQLFTVLSGQEVELPFKVDDKSVKIEPINEFRSFYDSTNATYYVGKNWRILATMNVYDKDYLFEMSYAFMRRFTFIYIDLPVDEEYKILIESWCDGLDGAYVFNMHELLKINPHREIGPAIFKDVVEYVCARKKIGSTDHILEDAVLSYIMPQFEGLEKSQILDIWKILRSIFEDSDEIKQRLEEISTVKLDEVK